MTPPFFGYFSALFPFFPLKLRLSPTIPQPSSQAPCRHQEPCLPFLLAPWCLLKMQMPDLGGNYQASENWGCFILVLLFVTVSGSEQHPAGGRPLQIHISPLQCCPGQTCRSIHPRCRRDQF